MEDMVRGLGPGWSLDRAPEPFGGLRNAPCDLAGAETEIGHAAREPRLAGHVLLVSSGASTARDLRFRREAERFWLKRSEAAEGPSLLVVDTSEAAPVAGAPLASSPEGEFGRADLGIWALLHLGALPDPLDRFAEALAIELGGLDLDRVARIASSDRRLLLRPSDLAAELDIDAADVGAAVWRAQARALFPWIEEWRCRVVRRHRRHLVLDERQRENGVRDVLDIEIGGLAHHLRGRVPARDYELVEALRDLRNGIAHGTPCPGRLIERAMTGAERFAAQHS